MALSRRPAEGIDIRRQRFSRDCSGAVVDQQMIRKQVRLDARDSIKVFQRLDDGLLRRTAAVAGQRKRCTLSCEDLSMQEKEDSAGAGQTGRKMRPHRTAVAYRRVPQWAGTGVISVWGTVTVHGTIGMSGAGLASGEATSTAIAPRNAAVNECVTRG